MRMSWCPRRRSILASFSLTGILLAIILIHKHADNFQKDTVLNSREVRENLVPDSGVYSRNDPQKEEQFQRNEPGIVLLREYTILNELDGENDSDKHIGEPSAVASVLNGNKNEERELGWNGRTLTEEKNSRELSFNKEGNLGKPSNNLRISTETENKVRNFGSDNILNINADKEQRDLPKSITLSNEDNLHKNQSSFKEENSEKLNEKSRSEEYATSYSKEIENEESVLRDVKKNYSEYVEVQTSPRVFERNFDLIENTNEDEKMKNEAKKAEGLIANSSGFGLESFKKHTTPEMVRSSVSKSSSSSIISNIRSSSSSSSSSSSKSGSSNISKKNTNLAIRPLNLSLSNYTNEKTNLHFNESLSKKKGKGTEIASYKKIFSQLIYLNKKFINRIFSNEPKDTDFYPGNRVPANKVRRVLIVSTWRSGSTFLGDIFNSYPAAFYSFEPLHMKYRNKHLQKGEDIAEALNFIKDIFTCNISSHQEYMKYLREYQYVLVHNKFMWNSCFGNRAFCFDSRFMSQICQLAPLNVMKTVRLGLLPVEKLLKDETLDLKVIHLVRDPRGSLHSRLKLSWCKSDICRNPKTVCDSLYTDLKFSDSYLKKYPEKFLVIRYEDLSLNPMVVSEKILSFVGLHFHNGTRNFLKEHTQLEGSASKRSKIGTYTTFRDSQSIPFHWRESFSFKGVSIIQKACSKTLDALGYKVFNSQMDYENKNISVLINS